MKHRQLTAATVLGAAIALALPQVADAQFKNALKAITTRLDVRKDHKDIPLREALADFGKATGVVIAIDPQSLKAGQNLADVENFPVRVPKLNGVLLANLLRHVAKQAGGGYVIRGDQLVVVFNRPDANAPTSEKTPLQKQLEAAVQKQLTIKTNVAKKDGVTLDDALYAIAYQHKLNLLIDGAEFRRAGKEQVENTLIDVPALKNVTVGSALQKLLAPARGTYHVRENVIWVEPAAKK